MSGGTTSDLDGRVAIVTGAQRGIGLATATLLANSGAHVVLADLPGSAVEDAAQAIGFPDRIAAQEVDIADEASVERLVSFTLSRFGRIDALDNNAAIGSSGDADIVDMRVEDWDRHFHVNVRGTMLMCKHAVPAMARSGGGSIVNMSSVAASAGNIGRAAYACSKGAIETLTRYVATQCVDQRIRCNAIAPGPIATDMLRAGMSEDVQKRAVASLLVRRMGETSDIAEMVRFLFTDRSSFINGQIIHVDGGMIAHLPTAFAPAGATTSG